MKAPVFKWLSLFLLGSILVACSPKSDDNGATPATSAEAATEAETVVAKAAEAPVGKAVYDRNCVACHQPNGKGIPPAFPSIAGSAVVMGDIDAQILLILNGVTGTAMVAFGPQLSDQDIADVITYQRNAFGNDTGDTVTAEQVAALR